MCRFLLALFCCWQVPVQAEKYIIASQNFNYYPHYNFQAKTDKGFIWAVLEAFSEVSGHQFEYQTMPVLRLQRELEKGLIDLVYPDNPLFNTHQMFAEGKYYSDTIGRTLSGTMVKAASLGKDPLTIKRISMPLGFASQKGWRDLVDSGEVTLVPVITPMAELQLLALGRVDAADVDYFVSQYQIKANPRFKGFTFDPTLPYSKVDFKLSTINQTHLIDEINLFVRSQPQIINKLKLEYGLEEPEEILQKLNASSPSN
jgi:hypothetical protein